MAVNPEGTRLLQQVKEGMTVRDDVGEDVGTVNFVHLSDPEAVTTESDRGAGERGDHGDSTILEPLIGDEDSGATERMRQTGYIRVDAKGWFTGDKYVGASDIASVESDRVVLSVDKDRL